MKKILCNALLALVLGGWWLPSAMAQDPMFSQFNAAPMQLNPALTGLTDAPVVYLNYRNQWSAINKAYATYSVAASHYSPNLHSGFGASILADVAGNGIYNTTQIGLSYAYDVRFDEEVYLRMGLEGAFVNKRLNWSKLVFLDQINPETGAYDANGNLNPTQETQGASNIGYFDMGLGALLRTRYAYGGISLKHLNSPQETFIQNGNVYSEIPMRITLHAGGEIPLNGHNKYKKRSFISPNALYVKQRQFQQLNFGANYQFDMWFGGVWFRHAFGNGDAVIMMAGLEKGVFKLGYSYDLTVSKLTPASGGTHEISLILNFEDKARKNRQRYNDCLKIFR